MGILILMILGKIGFDEWRVIVMMRLGLFMWILVGLLEGVVRMIWGVIFVCIRVKCWRCLSKRQSFVIKSCLRIFVIIFVNYCLM